MKKLLVLLVLALIVGGIVWWARPPAPRRHAPGVLVAADPLQGAVADSRTWQVGDYTIEPLATYHIEARVLHTHHYHFGRETDLSPLDLLLGWGPMSDQAVVDKLEFKQSQRWGYWRYQEAPLSDEEIASHASNCHIIPANDDLRDSLLDLRAGDIITLDGYLVEARADDGWKWRSSLTRDDTRGHACELIWVETLHVVQPKEPSP